MRENRLFMFDSPEAITIAKNGSTFLRNKDAYLLALKKGSLSLGVESLIDSIGVVDAFNIPTKLDSSYLDIVYHNNAEKLLDVLTCNALLYALLSLSFLSSEKENDLVFLLVPKADDRDIREYIRKWLKSLYTRKAGTYASTVLFSMVSVSEEDYLYPEFLKPLLKAIFDENGILRKANDPEYKYTSLQKSLNSLLRKDNGLGKCGSDVCIRKREERMRTAYADLSARIETIISSASDKDAINNALLEVLKEIIFHPQFLSSTDNHRIHKYSFLLEMEMPIVFGRKYLEREEGSPQNRFYSFKSLAELVPILAVDLCDGDCKKACGEIRKLLQEPRYNKLLREKHSGQFVCSEGKDQRITDTNLARAQLAALLCTVNPKDYEQYLECIPAPEAVSTNNPLLFEDGHYHLSEPLDFDIDCSFSFKIANKYSCEYIKNHPDVLSDAICHTLSVLHSNEGNANAPLSFDFELKSSGDDRDVIDIEIR